MYSRMHFREKHFLRFPDPHLCVIWREKYHLRFNLAYAASVPHPFDRYAAFTDLDALNKFSALPLRKAVRVNTLKCSVETFKLWAEEHGWKLSPVPWDPEGFYVERENHATALGRDLRHLLGHFYMQEAASMLPVALLDPQPGEIILDMCAAPGSKTTQIAARVFAGVQENEKSRRTSDLGLRTSDSSNGGLVIANDMQEKRLRILNDAVQRTGAMNAVIVRKVGQWYAKQMTERFDRVLCDAPCTAQGTVRKDSTALMYSSEDSYAKAARLQRELLEAAIHATKVGGRIVYSTCTLTPEENEGVVLSMLERFKDSIEVVPPSEIQDTRYKIQIDVFDQAFKDSIKVQDWMQSEGYTLSASFGPAQDRLRYPLLRLWPQTYDTEGFFCAVLRKVKSTKTAERMEWIHHEALPLSKRKIEEVKKDFVEQFGTDFLQAGDALVEKGNFVLLVSDAASTFEMPVSEYAMGVPFAKILNDGRYRVTNDLASLRGMMATRQIMDLSDDQLSYVLEGKDIACSTALRGDAILRYRDFGIGLGLAKDGLLLNRLPRWVVKVGGKA